MLTVNLYPDLHCETCKATKKHRLLGKTPDRQKQEYQCTDCGTRRFGGFVHHMEPSAYVALETLPLSMRPQSLPERAVAAWGRAQCANRTKEACGELIVALSRAQRNTGTIEQIAKQVAALEVMLAQLRKIVGEDAVEYFIQQEWARLRDLVDDAESRVTTTAQRMTNGIGGER